MLFHGSILEFEAKVKNQSKNDSVNNFLVFYALHFIFDVCLKPVPNYRNKFYVT